MFYTASISLAFLLSLILFTKKGRTKADVILASWLSMIGMHLGFYYASIIVDPYYYPYLLVSYPFPLLHGPMLYLYTSSLTSQHLYLKKHWAWHFIPAMMVYGMLIPFYFLSHAERLEVFANQGRGYEWVFTIQRLLVLSSGVVYVLISLLLLRNHKQTVRERFSQTENINLMWLRYLIYGCAIVWVAVFNGNDLIIFSLVALFVLLLGYFGIKQVGIFTQTNSDHQVPLAASSVTMEAPATDGETKGKYLKSTLSEETMHEIHRKLTVLMEEQKVFLNPELTLSDLATALAVHPNQLSQVVNSMESKPFYDFINGQRVEEFKKRVALPANQKFTLLALAFECGFNSKTAFYRNFKTVTGQSPTQYLKQQQFQIKE